METDVTEIWHIYSDGTRADIPFNADEDKLLAWNSVAICANDTGVDILVVTVNDTHMHLLARGKADRVIRFRDSLQHRLKLFFRNDIVMLACKPVTNRTEVLSTFMYVYRNSLDHFKKLPGEYPWGSGNIYFSKLKPRGCCLAEYSVRQQQMLLRTKKRLPQTWHISAVGKIMPESFIDVELVEQYFGSVRAFLAFQYVRKEDEAAMKQKIHNDYLVQRSIQELRKIGNRLSVNYCGRVLKSATLATRLKVATRMMREGLSGKTPSLAKALFLKPQDLNNLL